MSFSGLLKTTITYWSPAGNSGSGNLTYDAPVTLLCRWQDTVDTFQDFAGEEFISDAVIYTTTALMKNSWIYRGTSSESNPQNQEGAYRARRISRSQSPNGSIVVNKTILG